MTESGATPLEDGPGDGTKKPTWRRSGSGSRPPSPTPPAIPAGDPEELGEPDDLDLEDGGTLIQTPPQADASESGEVEGDHTIVSTPGADTTMALAGDLPKIPGITLTRELGRGGMGIVYEGKQGYLDRRVAVKFLGEGNLTTEFMRRFQREAKILASLSHPHVVSCYQAGVAEDGRCFLVMEYIDGPTLGEWIEEHGALPDDRAVSVCRAVATALAYAHGSGIIHRDVKPPNVLLKTKSHCDPDDPFPYEPMLADLGLARASGEVPTLVDITMKGLTAAGAVMGSPPTMAPEQFDSPDDVDFRTDIYGLGCILFHCLTGKLAFPQGTLTKLISRKTSGAPPDPRDMRKDVSPQLSGLVADMLAPSPEDRPESYAELLRRFEGPFEPGKATRSRAPIFAAAAVVALAGGWIGWRALAPGDSPEETDPDVARGNEASLSTPDFETTDAPTDPRGPDERTETRDDPAEPGPRGDSKGDGTPAFADDEASEPAPDELDVQQEARDEPADVDDQSDAGEEGSVADSTTAEDTATDPAPLPWDPTETEPTPNGSDADPAEDAPGEDGDAADSRAETFEPPPDLPAIAPGESWELFASTMDPLSEWDVTAGDPAKWQATGDERNSVSPVFFVGERGVARRPLPAPSWSLTGEVALLRQRSDETPRRLRVLVVLQSGRGLLLGQELVENELRLGGAWAAPSEDGGWIAEEELPALSLGTLAWNRKGPAVDLEAAWDGQLLAISWGLSGAEGERVRAELTREDLAEVGMPIALAIELENGPGRLRHFVVQGR